MSRKGALDGWLLKKTLRATSTTIEEDNYEEQVLESREPLKKRRKYSRGKSKEKEKGKLSLPSDLNIVYWNIHFYNAAKHKLLCAELNDYEEDIHVICISETHLRTDLLEKNPMIVKGERYSYKFYPRVSVGSDATTTTTTTTGMYIFYHPSLIVTDHPSYSLHYERRFLEGHDGFYGSDTAWVTFEYTSGTTADGTADYTKFVLGLVYFHPKITKYAFEELLANIEKVRKAFPRVPVLFGGDFNIRHHSWSSNCPRSDGGHTGAMHTAEALSSYLYSHFSILNTIFAKHLPTYNCFNIANGPSTLDLVISNRPELCVGVKILEWDKGASDHSPLLVIYKNMSTHQKLNMTLLREPRYRWKMDEASTLDWHHFSTGMDHALSVWQATFFKELSVKRYASVCESYGMDFAKELVQADIDRAADGLTEIMLASARRHIGKKRVGYKRFGHAFTQGKDSVLPLRNAMKRACDKVRECQAKFIARQKVVTDPDTDPRSVSLRAKHQALKDDLKAKKKALYSHLRELQSQYIHNRFEKLAQQARKDSNVPWKLVRQQMPAASKLSTSIRHPVTERPAANIVESNSNLAVAFAAVCSTGTYTDYRSSTSKARTNSFMESLAEHWQSLLSNEQPDPDAPTDSESDDDEDFMEAPISLTDLDICISQLNVHKAGGADEIENSMIKHSSDLFKKCLCFLYDCCYRLGTLPLMWTRANVFPIYKNKGDPTDSNNYRPISLTSCFMRLFERCLLPRMGKHLYPLLHPSQTGFRAQHQTDDNLCRLLDSVYKHLSARHSTETVPFPVIYLDLTKAFDRINTSLALEKLSRFRLTKDSKALHFFKAFLSNRYMRTVGAFSTPSEWRMIDCGTPQGTVFAPLLFSVYIDDLLNRIEDETACIAPAYADDVVLIPQVRWLDTTDEDTLIAETRKRKLVLQQALNICGEWATENNMSFSGDKTQYMVFHKMYSTRTFHVDVQDMFPKVGAFKLKQNGVQMALSVASSYKYLGVHLRQDALHLFDEHVNDICTKMTKRVGILLRLMRPAFPVHLRHHMADSLVHSLYRYALCMFRLLGGQTERYVRTLKPLWANVLNVSPHACRVEDLMDELNIRPIEAECETSFMKFLYRAKYMLPARHVTKKWFLENQAQEKVFKKTRSWTYKLRPIYAMYLDMIGEIQPKQVTYTRLLLWKPLPHFHSSLDAKVAINAYGNYIGKNYLFWSVAEEFDTPSPLYHCAPGDRIYRFMQLRKRILEFKGKAPAPSPFVPKHLATSSSSRGRSAFFRYHFQEEENQSRYLIPFDDCQSRSVADYIASCPSTLSCIPMIQLRLGSAPIYSYLVSHRLHDLKPLLPYPSRVFFCRSCKEPGIEETFDHLAFYCAETASLRQELANKMEKLATTYQKCPPPLPSFYPGLVRGDLSPFRGKPFFRALVAIVLQFYTSLYEHIGLSIRTKGHRDSVLSFALPFFIEGVLVQVIDSVVHALPPLIRSRFSLSTD